MYFGATTDLSTLSCPEIIKKYNNLKLLSTPEGGRSKTHQKEAADRLKVVQPFFDSCVNTGSPLAHPDQDVAAINQKIADDGQYPALSSTAMPGGGFSISPVTVGLLVVAGLAGVWFLTRSK